MPRISEGSTAERTDSMILASGLNRQSIARSLNLLRAYVTDAKEEELVVVNANEFDILHRVGVTV